MAETQLSSYEEVPYDSKPLYPTHPDCLATVATLMGMTPAPVDRCRVLELGCATGGNLLPMAQALPESRFVGIDLSSRQIAEGQAAVQRLGLNNLDLRALSILDVDEAYGQFDYIICHGVYSWVPAVVQDHILAICRRNLAPQGVAYVSYNTYPGWHLRRLARDMMSYHVKRFDEPQVRVGQARAFLDFLIQAMPNPDSTYHRLLKEEADVLRSAADTYLFHEHLEDENHPVYFHQFMERAAAKGLQYLGESWYHTRLDNLQVEVRQVLENWSDDLLQLEQYLDFLRNRTFRRTLLCHDHVTLNRTPGPQVMMGMHVTALIRPTTPQPDLDSEAEVKFLADDGNAAATNDPVIKAALCVLFDAWPEPLPFPTLWSAAQKRLPKTMQHNPRLLEAGPQIMADGMFRCYLANLTALHVHPPRFVVEVSARPAASPLARWQASSSPKLTNLRHRQVEVTELERVVLPYLDGTRDRAALVEVLVGLVGDKVLTVQAGGQPPQDVDQTRGILREALDLSLRRLAKHALLVA